MAPAVVHNIAAWYLLTGYNQEVGANSDDEAVRLLFQRAAGQVSRVATRRYSSLRQKSGYSYRATGPKPQSAIV